MATNHCESLVGGGIVILLFPLWYAKLHEPVWSSVIAIIPFLGIWIMGHFWSIFYPDKRKQKRILLTMLYGLALIIMVVLIPLSLEDILLTLTLKNHQFVVPQKDFQQAQKADYWGEYPDVHLEEANLELSNFAKVNLENGHFQRAILYKAVLWGRANLTKAVLLEIQTLSVPQLCNASTLFNTVLADSLREGVQQQCPKKLLEPSEEKKPTE